MQRRIVVIAMVSALSLSSAAALHAAPVGIFPHHAADNATTGKLIHFSVRNDSAQPLVLQAGAQQFTVAAGKSLSMKLPEGTDLVTLNGTAKSAPGSVLTKVSSMLENNTLAVS